jgi:heme exporter protein A
LLRILCGLLQPAEGTVHWNGTAISSLEEDYVTHVTYIGHRSGVKDELTPLENLLVSGGLSGIEPSESEAISVLERLGLKGRELIPARLLSEGQRRRVALARLAVCKTELWLLDEVTSSLDKSAVELIRSLIEEHLTGGGIAIVATHQDFSVAKGRTQRLELTT